ncbi:hypothetical protein BDZ91DRAFT_791435 [Kalaharituber pfeilii]|nr:hypothetical protein BDZ91DRAFT_791435 [Kalaharituber pfeilii]
MIIKTLFTHPIKSLRPISVEATVIVATGPLHDRQFMLIRPAAQEKTVHENMNISKYSQLCLFLQQFYPSGCSIEDAEGVLVTYRPPERPRIPHAERAKNGVLLASDERVLRVPLRPDTRKLATRKVNMHGSECIAYDMGDSPYAQFFSECLGMDVRLLYLAPGTFRKVLGNVAPSPAKEAQQGGGWLSRVLPSVWRGENDDGKGQWGITFADCAPLLVTTEWSLEDVSKRFRHSGNGCTSTPDGSKGGMDMSKFRPNIVLGPSPQGGDDTITAWDEDFWAELMVHPRRDRNTDTGEATDVKILLTQNAGRCRTINVEYHSGDFGDTKLPDSEEPLKYLMKDRRVDPGSKWNPIFGRYGFLGEDGPVRVSVGDRVEVVRRNQERTVFSWPGLSTEPSAVGD